MATKTIRIVPMKNKIFTASIRNANKSTTGLSWSNASNCHGKPLKQKKVCEECGEVINDKECTHKLAKVGKELIPIPKELIEQAKSAREANSEIVIQEFRAGVPEDWSSWLDNVQYVESVTKKESDYTYLAKMLGDLYAIGTLDGQRIVMFVRNGQVQMQTYANPDAHYEQKEAPAVSVNTELADMLHKIAEKASQQTPELDVAQESDYDKTIHELVEKAYTGQPLPVPQEIANRAEADELEELKALL
jgi:non-homologous end joining protein Ku